jgi:hypothetical protein
MKIRCGLATRCLGCLAVIAAAVACGSPHPLVATPGDAGDDASDDPGHHPDAGVDATPDAGEPGDLATMCGSVPTTLQDWERCRVKRLCETLVHCSERNLYTDAQECIALRDTLLDGEVASDVFESTRAVAARRASIDVAAFTQCLQELSPERCSTAGTAPSCATRYTGTVADGQPCFNNAECASPGASCSPSECGASCCAGTCTPRRRLGQACNGTDLCEPGLVCSISTLKCETGDVGSACGGFDFDCDAGNWCDHGICKPDLAEGVQCNSILQCRGETSCVGKYRHVEAVPRCRHVTSVGDACDDFCLGNLLCDLSNPAGFGVCRSLPRRGEPCNPLVGCIGQSDRCGEQGTCIPRTAAGQPCVDGTCLPGLFCTDQLGAANPVCRVPFADGESGCKQGAQCQSRVCSGNEATPGRCQPAQSMCP